MLAKQELILTQAKRQFNDAILEAVFKLRERIRIVTTPLLGF
jgi:hypothetical protein